MVRMVVFITMGVVMLVVAAVERVKLVLEELLQTIGPMRQVLVEKVVMEQQIL